MMQVLEKENVLLKKCRDYMEEGRKLYIFGSGLAGRFFYDVLQLHQVSVDGFCVDPEYFKPDTACCSLPVYSVDALLAGAGIQNKIAIVIAFMGNRRHEWESNEDAEIVDLDFWSLGSICNFKDNIIDSKFIEDNTGILNELYDCLADDKSRQCMTAFLNQRISGKFGYLEPLAGGTQYYEQELYDISRISCMVDCGAFDGDSYREFSSCYELAAGEPYKGRAFLLEPDKNNFEKMASGLSGCNGAVPLNIGVWDKKDVLFFQEGEMSGSIVENGSISVNADSIDNITSDLRGGVDLIKMDIEGSELNALKGAEAVIRKYHPVLAVCVYHKKEDLLEIPQYIKSLYPGYKLYLRTYSKYCQELVLYAVG